MKSTGHGFLEPNMTKTHSLLWCERKQIFTLWHLINNFSVISKGNKMHDLLTKDTSTQGVGLCGFKISRLQTFFHLRKDRFHVLYSIKELLKKTTSTSAYSVREVLSGGDLPPLYVQSWFLTLSHQFITCTVRQMSWHLGQLAHHQAVSLKQLEGQKESFLLIILTIDSLFFSNFSIKLSNICRSSTVRMYL